MLNAALGGMIPGGVAGVYTQMRELKLVDQAREAYDAAATEGAPGRRALYEEWRAAEELSNAPIRTFFKGAAKGALAAALDVGFDTTLQKTIGENLAGCNLFKPTTAEVTLMSASAALPLDLRLKLALTAASWLEGRAENYYSSKNG
jgi:hypothetical protein